MWSPTHVQVTVQRAKGLLTKGKNGKNDAFVTIALGKEKYQTSVKEKSLQDVEWHEECELAIPQHGNVAEIVLTALHRNFIGVDEFLGVVNIPLADLDVYERPKNKWYELKSKPGKQKNKARGELEVKISFVVKAGSLNDLKKKHRSSLGQLSHMAQSVVRRSKKNEKEPPRQSYRTSIPMSSQIFEDADPGVISEGESIDDFRLEELSHRSSGSSMSYGHRGVGSVESLSGQRSGSVFKSSNLTLDKKDTLEMPKRLSRESRKSSLSSQLEENEDISELEHRSPSPSLSLASGAHDKERPKESSLIVRKFRQFRRESKLFDVSTSDKKTSMFEERVIVGGETSKLSPELLQRYVGKSKEDLVEIICSLQTSLEIQTKRVKDLEEYLDNLLLRVMETSPRILQNPYGTNILSNKVKIECDESAA